VRLTSREIMLNAAKAGKVVPAFNIPYLPVMAPVVEALRDTQAFGLVQVARLECIKFEAGSLRAVRDEYERVKDERYTRLHLDHCPVIDEDDLRVDFEPVIAEAVELGYDSVMIDGSRLGLDENIAATAKAVDIARRAGVPVEAELGAVLGHEAGPLPPYEELFASGKGFTDPAEAKRLVDESGAAWLSVAVGNIHGAISAAKKNKKKIAARLNIEHLARIREATDVPLVLHGGSGIPKDYLMAAFAHGIAKINIATTIRQAYETGQSAEQKHRNVYDATVALVTDKLEIAADAAVINPQ